jgi:hypothetical protein
MAIINRIGRAFHVWWLRMKMAERHSVMGAVGLKMNSGTFFLQSNDE